MTFDEWYASQAHQLSNEPTCRVIWNAAIAARDEELRKQEPVAWIHPLYKESGFKLVGITRWSDDCLPLYAAPIPPDNHDWKAEYLRQVDLHNQTLDELREAEMQLRNPAPIPPTVPDTNLETATNRNYLESIGQLPPTEGSKP